MKHISQIVHLVNFIVINLSFMFPLQETIVVINHEYHK